jgi:hypothetical protein
MTTSTQHSDAAAPPAPATVPDPARSRAALVAGAGLLAMAAVAVPANAALQPLVGAGGPAEVGARLADGANAARLAVLGFLGVVVLDIVVAWGLARFLQRDTPSLATLGGWLRVGYAAMLGAAVIRLGEALRADEPSVALTAVRGFDEGWRLALLVFGVHLGVVGVALLRTRDVPRWLAAGVVLAGLAYVVDTVVRTMLADPSSVGAALTVAVAVLATVGELGLAVWLLVRGRRS